MEEGLCSYGKQKMYKFIMPGPSLQSREVRVVHSATSSKGREILPVPMSQGPYMDMDVDMEGHGCNKYQFTHLEN